MLSMHLRQLFRKPIRIISYILMLVLLSAFFCMKFLICIMIVNVIFSLLIMLIQQ